MNFESVWRSSIIRAFESISLPVLTIGLVALYPSITSVAISYAACSIVIFVIIISHWRTRHYFYSLILNIEWENLKRFFVLGRSDYGHIFNVNVLKSLQILRLQLPTLVLGVSELYSQAALFAIVTKIPYSIYMLTSRAAVPFQNIFSKMLAEGNISKIRNFMEISVHLVFLIGLVSVALQILTLQNIVEIFFDQFVTLSIFFPYLFYTLVITTFILFGSLVFSLNSFGRWTFFAVSEVVLVASLGMIFAVDAYSMIVIVSCCAIATQFYLVVFVVRKIDLKLKFDRLAFTSIHSIIIGINLLTAHYGIAGYEVIMKALIFLGGIFICASMVQYIHYLRAKDFWFPFHF